MTRFGGSLKAGERILGPLKPAPAHPHFPLRGWMVVRYRGGIREREGECERAEGAWIKIKMKIKGFTGLRTEAAPTGRK